jgi:hypothetical protein
VTAYVRFLIERLSRAFGAALIRERFGVRPSGNQESNSVNWLGGLGPTKRRGNTRVQPRRSTERSVHDGVQSLDGITSAW